MTTAPGDADAEDAETDDSEQTPYERVEHRIGRILDVEKTEFLLFWDTDVMMPPDGEPARSSQQSTLNAIRHELLADPWLGETLDAVDESALTDEEAAVVREVRREHEVAARVPDELNEELGRATGEAFGAWKRARADDDFEAFVPHLRRHVDLRREWGREAAPDDDADPYHALWEQAVGYHSQAYVPYETVDRVFDRLREELVPLIDAVRESDVEPGAGVFEGTFDADAQMALSRAALDAVGFPWEHGRLDLATHPFSSGTTFDTRVTTRFDESDPVDGLAATLHEFGHSDYTLGLREDAFGTPLGEARSHGVHESQSRFWENHVGRSEAFWEFFLPTMREQFPQVEASPAEAYAAANAVDPGNYIRVEADELTYHMHIVLRFEIERALVNGDIEVREVPALWNEKSEAYLGLTPPTDTLGCLQDIHWSLGRIGTFQNYSIGSVLAAQLEGAMEADLGPIDEHVRAGEFDPVHDWLEENVQSHGSRYRTDELVRQATGESFTADYFLDYLTGKMEALYDL